MREENIAKMDFKQLRTEVQYLRDELAIFKRKYEDAIYNLDSDNFGKGFVIAQDNMKAQIKITAAELETRMSDAEGNVSTLTQTASALEVRISNTQDAVTILQATANGLSSRVTSVEEDICYIDDGIANIGENIEELYSEIEQTASGITSIVGKNISAHFTSTKKPTKEDTDDAEKSMLCLYNEIYYYYNDITEKWEVHPGSGVASVFEQTPDGFKLTGDVSISGDLVSGGAIYGSTLNLYYDHNTYGTSEINFKWQLTDEDIETIGRLGMAYSPSVASGNSRVFVQLESYGSAALKLISEKDLSIKAADNIYIDSDSLQILTTEAIKFLSNYSVLVGTANGEIDAAIIQMVENIMYIKVPENGAISFIGPVDFSGAEVTGL